MPLAHRIVPFALVFACSAALAIEPALVPSPPVPSDGTPFVITVFDPNIWAGTAPTVQVTGQTIDIEGYNHYSCVGPPIPSRGYIDVPISGLPAGHYDVTYRRVSGCGPRPIPLDPLLTLESTVSITTGAPPSLELIPDPPVALSALTVDARWTSECPVTGVEVASVATGGVLRLTADGPCTCPALTSLVSNHQTIAIDQRLDTGRYRMELLQRCTTFVGVPPPAGLVAETSFLVAHEGGVIDLHVAPIHPSEDQEIVLHLSVPCFDTSSSFALESVEGNVLRIAHRTSNDPPATCDGATDPFRVLQVPIGRLPAATYAILIEQPESDALSFAEVLEVTPGMSETLTLQGGRFQIRAAWATSRDNGSARARPLAGSGDAGAFWFFRPDNAELLIKVLDGCSQNGHFWVFAAGLTNLAVDLTIKDTLTGTERSYPSPLGTDFEPIQDIRAFDTCEVSTGGAS